jgi:hypothetical protein
MKKIEDRGLYFFHAVYSSKPTNSLYFCSIGVWSTVSAETVCGGIISSTTGIGSTIVETVCSTIDFGSSTTATGGAGFQEEIGGTTGSGIDITTGAV